MATPREAMDRDDARRAMALLMVFLRLARIGKELEKVVDDLERATRGDPRVAAKALRG